MDEPGTFLLLNAFDLASPAESPAERQPPEPGAASEAKPEAQAEPAMESRGDQ
jgi:hypothetical protein